MPVELSRPLQARIVQQMENTFPNEGGGFLLGTQAGDMTRIVDVIQIENLFESEEQYHRYMMSPENWIKMEDEAEARGLLLAGYYHSHPDSPAIPSEYDHSYAWPRFIWLITSVMAGKADHLRAWILRDDGSEFEETELRLSGE